MKMNRKNLIIYLIAFVASVVFLGLYFIDPQNKWCVVSCSVGASGISAVLLGFFIERSNYVYSKKKYFLDRETVLYPILLWLGSSICRFISYLDQIGNEFEIETVKEFFSVFEKLHRKEVLGEYSFIKKIDEGEYLYEVKNCFIDSPIAITAIKDLTNNRSYVLQNNLFTDNEIRDINLLSIQINDLKHSISTREIHTKLQNVFCYINLPEIENIQIKKDEGGLNFFYNNKEIFIERGYKI